MAEREFFVGPKDVTEEYRERVKAPPRSFALLLLFWSALTLLTVTVSLLWQLIDAVLLVLIFVGFHTSLFEKRRKYSAALKKGGIEKLIQLVDDRIEQVIRAKAVPHDVIETTTVEMTALFEVRVVANSVWVGSVNGGDSRIVYLEESDFTSDEARREFIDMLLNRMRRRHFPDDDDDLNETFDPLIPKY